MNRQASLTGLDAPVERVEFTPTRDAGLARLDQFVSRAGRHYANHRNYDYGPDRRDNVSALSPWIRHRLISEQEVLHAVLARHSVSSAEKYIQEVFWRSYFKGWLEQRPGVWLAYQQALQDHLAALDRFNDLSEAYATAIDGKTGIDCFDAWAVELVETGYLHNHARMWFASIWVFTLRLPWELGADFFLRHLLDGDPASNTLSWRWVAGLHTKGKAYQARASNVSKYTEGRFTPLHQLATEIEPLTEAQDHDPKPIGDADTMPEGEYLLLMTEDDLTCENWLPHPPVRALGFTSTKGRSSLPAGKLAMAFSEQALADALSRSGADHHMLDNGRDLAEAVMDHVEATGVRDLVAPFAPTGPTGKAINDLTYALTKSGVRLHQVRRPYDSLVWPHCSRGFFGLKKKIPQLLREIGLAA